LGDEGEQMSRLDALRKPTTTKPGDTVDPKGTHTTAVTARNNRAADYCSTRKVRRVPAPTPQAKRPPCDACGEESDITDDGREIYDSVIGPVRLCYDHWRTQLFELTPLIRARRAKQASGSFDPSSLPTYSGRKCEACAEPATDGLNDNGDWVRLGEGDYEVCRACAEANPEEVLEAIRSKQFTGTDAPLRRQQPTEPRWQTTDPARIAALEAKLAEQMRSGGQDGKSARYLVERADELAREEQARSEPYTRRDRDHTLQHLTPGPIFNRRDYRPRPRRK
jgi:hypothetical protein